MGLKGKVRYFHEYLLEKPIDFANSDTSIVYLDEPYQKMRTDLYSFNRNGNIIEQSSKYGRFWNNTCKKLDYKDGNLIKEIDLNLMDKIEGTRIYTYDRHDSLIEKHESGHSDSYFNSLETITYEQNPETKIMKYAIEEDSFTFYSISLYDSMAGLKQTVTLDSAYKLVGKEVYFLNSKQFVVEYIIDECWHNDHHSFGNYIYDKNNRLVKKESRNNTDWFKNVFYDYNSKGLLLSEMTLNKDASKDEIRKYSYDSLSNNILIRDYHLPDSTLRFQESMAYDQYGNCITEECDFFRNGATKEYWVRSYIYYE